MRREVMARLQEFIRDFAAVRAGGQKFLMIHTGQRTKPLIQSEQLTGQNGDLLFNATSHETIRIWNIHHGPFLDNKRASRAESLTALALKEFDAQNACGSWLIRLLRKLE